MSVKKCSICFDYESCQADGKRCKDKKLTCYKPAYPILEAENEQLKKQIEEFKSFDSTYIIPCECGSNVYTHRHTNWIECIKCHLIKVLK